jgi:hypothetical protein
MLAYRDFSTGGSVVMQNRRPIDVKLAGYGPDDLVAWEVCTYNKQTTHYEIHYMPCTM